jgi:hypothetical protein
MFPSNVLPLHLHLNCRYHWCLSKWIFSWLL